MPKVTKTLYAPDRKAWRAWLATNHGTEPEIWLVHYRKDTGKPRVSYNDAVEEALAFGWIDSTLGGHPRTPVRKSPAPLLKRLKLSRLSRDISVSPDTRPDSSACGPQNDSGEAGSE